MLWRTAAPPITPSQLRPTKIFDAQASSTGKKPETYDGIPVDHVVTYGSSSSDQSFPSPLKNTITFPLDASSGTTKETLLKLHEEPRTPVEIHIIKHDASGRAHALDANDWQRLEEMVDDLSGKDFERNIIICKSPNATSVFIATQYQPLSQCPNPSTIRQFFSRPPPSPFRPLLPLNTPPHSPRLRRNLPPTPYGTKPRPKRLPETPAAGPVRSGSARRCG